MRVLGLFVFGLTLWAQDYKASPGGAPPSQLSDEVRQTLQDRGAKIVDPNGFLFCELWLRSGAVFKGASLPEALEAGSLPGGTLVGAIRYASPGADRAGRGFGPGLYTLRFAQGDSLLMIRAGDDPGLAPVPVEQLEESSRKVTRSDAPATLSLRRAAGGSSPRLSISRDGVWTLQAAVNGAPLALLIVGVAK
jgi:hypothetical protein